MSRSQKRFTLIILGVFTTLLIIASLTGCETLQSQVERPSVKLAGISLLEAGLIRQVYGVTLEVDNPNGFTLPIKSVNYAVKVGGQQFATGLTPNGFSIPANGSDQIQVEVSTNLLESLGHLGRMLSGSPQELDYELSGDIQIDLPLVGPIPFNQAGTIPLTRSSKAE